VCFPATKSSRCWHRTGSTARPSITRAHFSSVDLTGRDFSGLDLRGIKMDHAVLSGADFSGANLQGANLIGAIAQQARFDRADLSRAHLSGTNLVSASFENTRFARVEMEFALMANAVLWGARLGEADMNGAQSLFWPEAHREAPICAGVFYRSQSSPSPNLPDTNLEDAEGLRQAQVDRAHLNIGTELPEGLTEPEYAK